MGIRYYAYAFDGDVTDLVLADPRRFLSSDPFADAWGLVDVDGLSIAPSQQAVPECDMLYLDKAWRQLQACTAPLRDGGHVRPAFRMFEGQVTMHHDGWEPWLRVLTPADVAAVSQDLYRISDADLRMCIPTAPHIDEDSDFRYAAHFLERAKSFVTQLVAGGRGMVYMIG